MDQPTEEQKARIRAVIVQIEARPDTFQMSHWFWITKSDPLSSNPKEWCGTAACIAGHACLQAGYTFRDPESLSAILIEASTGRLVDPEVEGRDLLGLPEWVFYINQWPVEFRVRLERGDFAGNPHRRVNEADIAIELLTRLLDDEDPLWDYEWAEENEEEEEEEEDEEDEGYEADEEDEGYEDPPASE